MEMTDEDFIKMYDDGIEFDEEWRKGLALGDLGERVTVERGEDHRWDTEMTTICKICGRYFAIDWRAPLTEYREASYWNQPYEVIKHQYQKTITITEWIPSNQ